MMTWLPHPDFGTAARLLRDRELKKQCNDVLLLLEALAGLRQGERHLVDMWKKYPKALASLGVACCQEWNRRGGDAKRLRQIQAYFSLAELKIPRWLGITSLHASHRAGLLAVSRWYRRHGWDDTGDLVWPTEGLCVNRLT